MNKGKMDEEDVSERMNRILNLCEMDPNACLELIEQTIKNKPEPELNPSASEFVGSLCLYDDWTWGTFPSER
jgi:hypothetical protein